MNKKIIPFHVEVVEDDLKWQLFLDQLITSSTYIKWWWGDYKKKNGWSIKRLQIVDSNSKQLIACCQLQSKRISFINIYFIQGGIHLSKKNNIKNVYDNIFQALNLYIKKNKNWLWLLLINYQSHHFDEAEISMMKIGFTPILTKKMFTYLISRENLNKDSLSLSKNWRHNLKRAIKNTDLEIEWISSYENRKKVLSQLAIFYKNLAKRKKFNTAINLTHGMELLALDKSIMIVQAKLRGEVVAIRVVSICNDHLLDLIAASNEGAKKCYANYLLMWEMVLKIKELGKKYFDTGGVDPASNFGVLNFKKGLNGRLVINGPFWCFGSNRILLWLTRLFFV